MQICSLETNKCSQIQISLCNSYLKCVFLLIHHLITQSLCKCVHTKIPNTLHCTKLKFDVFSLSLFFVMKVCYGSFVWMTVKFWPNMLCFGRIYTNKIPNTILNPFKRFLKILLALTVCNWHLLLKLGQNISPNNQISRYPSSQSKLALGLHTSCMMCMCICVYVSVSL